MGRRKRGTGKRRGEGWEGNKERIYVCDDSSNNRKEVVFMSCLLCSRYSPKHLKYISLFSPYNSTVMYHSLHFTNWGNGGTKSLTDLPKVIVSL